MKTLNLYIARQLIGTTAIGAGVLTFVMLTANLVRAFDLFARGVSARVLGRFILYQLPISLSLTLPLALLCATILVFSRMSADNEVMAMKAIGISLWQVVAPGLLFAVALCGLCFYLQTTLVPHCRYRSDILRRSEVVKSPLALIEPGRFIDLPGYLVYVGHRRGADLEDIHLYGLADDGRVAQDITAGRGSIRLDAAASAVELHLVSPTIGMADPGSGTDGAPRQPESQNLVVRIPFGADLDSRPLERRVSHMDLPALFSCMHVFPLHGYETRPLYVELHTRMSMALSPLAFLLLGIPFGIRTRRSETSVGLLVSLVLAMLFYVFLTLADSLRHQAGVGSEILVWAPNVAYQAGGLWALHRISRH